MRILPLTTILVLLGAPAAAKAGTAPLAARGFRGGGFRSSRPRTAPGRRYAPNRYRARPHLGRRIFRGVLQALGIAFLLNALFGWGVGGSPLGLLLLFGLILWLVARRRRRVAYARW